MNNNPAPAKEAKLWGGRFEEGVTDAVERFTESISFDKALYKHDIMGSRAHALMLAHQVFDLLSPLVRVCVFFFSFVCKERGNRRERKTNNILGNALGFRIRD